MQASPKNNRNWQNLIGEFQHNSDRSVAILGTAYLQNYLGRLLSNFFISDSQNTNELLLQRGALSTFDTRIRAAYALGLISSNEFNDLLQIMHIHNIFLNELDISKFTDESLRQHCSQLRIPREILLPEETVTPRRLFVFAVALLSGQLIWRSEQAENEQRAAPENFILVDMEP